VLPSELTEFRWIGQGPYAGYRGKDRHNEFGLFHLNREDLNYQGNRRETECALVTTPNGTGVELVTAAADVAIERDGDETLLSHNAVISGLGNKGTSPETFIDADKTARVSGSFTLILLEDSWPTMLVRWFGEPATARSVFRPFHHSYDQ
jgi:beta-galactosidase